MKRLTVSIVAALAVILSMNLADTQAQQRPSKNLIGIIFPDLIIREASVSVRPEGIFANAAVQNVPLLQGQPNFAPTAGPSVLRVRVRKDGVTLFERDVAIPALKAGFVVLTDRYIFTALARAGVRGVDRHWLRTLYGFAVAAQGASSSAAAARAAMPPRRPYVTCGPSA